MVCRCSIALNTIQIYLRFETQHIYKSNDFISFALGDPTVPDKNERAGCATVQIVRDLTRNRRLQLTRLKMPYVTALTNVLSQSLGWHRARMTFMARFVLCSLQLTTTNLRRIGY